MSHEDRDSGGASPRPVLERSRRVIYQAFRAGRLDGDEATADLLAVSLVERQARRRADHQTDYQQAA